MALLVNYFGANNQLTLGRGDTLALAVTGLGDLSSADDLWFAVKRYPSDTDATAEILIGLVDGLISVAGAAATTPANGSIVIDDAISGDITVNLTAGEMTALASFNGYWDVQKLEGATVTTLRRGNARLLGDTTRRIT